MWLCSGVFFSYERFPEVFHPLIKALPLTALNDALRANMLEGAALTGVLPELGVMAAWAGGCFLVALKIFRWA
jgi:ABC-2 type transport system permease protein